MFSTISMRFRNRKRGAANAPGDSVNAPVGGPGRWYLVVMSERQPRTTVRTLAVVFLAWTPFAVLWGIFNIITYDVAPGRAFLAGATAMGSAAILSVGVWYVTRAVPWPDHLRVSFYALHVGLALVFSVSWLFLGGVLGALAQGESLSVVLPNVMEFFAWRMLAGLWLYGLTAGVAYAIQIREALRVQVLAAERARTLAAEAQLETLRAQMNPHFFFNALHALSGLIHRDPALADDALDRIGRLLRRSLASNGLSLVPLAEEWEFTEGYLELERLRLGDRLQVDLECDPAASTCPVPPFTLQPLVENAVQHGVASSTEGGHITVRATRDGHGLTLEVADDGPGFGEDDGRGRGLPLLRQRLDAIYGGRASLTVGPADAGGCLAVVRVPGGDP